MRFLFSILALTLLSVSVFAQIPAQRGNQAAPQPLPTRQVSGVVKDSTDQGVIGAVVSLISSADTLKVSTNAEGVFVFRAVKSWVFTLSVSSMGYQTYVKRGQYNDATARLAMDPIILKTASTMLNEVVLNGTPSIVYKVDTVEYRASDYVVRAGATVDELLKKMEGFDVTSDGQVTHNGESIGRARLNGKDLFGGDIASVIQNLPADIIEKAQVVDDYGDVARRTGVKDGDPQKVLNLTTRTDRSVGNMVRLNGGLGTTDRYEGSVTLTRINGNRTIGLQMNNLSKYPNGIAGGNAGVGRLQVNRGNRGGGGGGSNVSGGSTFNFDPRLTYRDQIGEKVRFNLGYSFNYNNPYTVVNSESQNISPRIGTTDMVRVQNSDSYSRSHQFDGEFEFDLDSSNYLQFRPNVRISTGDTYSNSITNQVGGIHQDQTNRGSSSSSTPTFGATLAYQHVWLTKPGRSFSIETTASRNKNENSQLQDNNIIYYDGATDVVLKDSIVNRLVTTNSFNNSYRASATYAEPLSSMLRLELNSNLSDRVYDNAKFQNNMNTGVAVRIDSLSNIYNYSFLQLRNSLNFRYGTNTSLVNFSLGLTGVNTKLSGTKASLGTSIDQAYFKLIPLANFQLRFSRQHTLSARYSGQASEPSFDQIQPVRDVSNPQNPVVGNPNLKVQFQHSINFQYGNYIANSQFSYQLNGSTSFTRDAVERTVVNIPDKYGSFIRETHFLNVDGDHNHNVNYNVSKGFSDRRYRFNLGGSVSQSNSVSFVDGVKSIAKNWRVTTTLGPAINPTQWLEINPYVSYNTNKSDVTLASLKDTYIKTWAYSLDGNIYFLKNWQFGYALSKNYVDGIDNGKTQNPFIINASLQTRVFQNRAALQIRAFDILNQNNFVNFSQSATGFSRVYTNPVSRYFMVNLSMNLQKWTGASGRNGRSVQRRNDGSFIN
jgi:hypothetical protein